MSGWIKLHRKILEWEWYDNINTSRLFLHLLLTVNYEDKRWRGIVIKRGQRATSIENLAKETGLSKQSVRTTLTNLKSTRDLTCETTNKYTILTIEKYEEYQSEPMELTRKLTSEQQTTNKQSNKQLTTTKEIKEIKEIKGGLPGCINLDTWNNFVEMRKEIKKPLTVNGSKLIIKKLLKFKDEGEDPNKILEESTMNSWQGVFPIKKDKKTEKPVESVWKPQNDYMAELMGMKNGNV